MCKEILRSKCYNDIAKANNTKPEDFLMSRMSARFIGQKVGLATKDVYNMWERMGFVIKDKFGDWILTDAGKAFGGKLSQGNYPVPTFKFDDIVNAMVGFYNKNK